MTNSHSADGRKREAVRFGNRRQLAENRLTVTHRQRHRDRQRTRMPLGGDGRKIFQRSPETLLVSAFHFADYGGTQLGAVPGQHRVASGGAKANGPPSAGRRTWHKQLVRLRRNQLQANGIQRRVQYAVAEFNRLGSTGKNSDEGPRLPRGREELEAGAGNDSQRALAADEQLHHVVPGDVLYHPATTFGLPPVAAYKAHSDTVIAQAAVAVAQRPVQPGSQQSTDGAALGLRGVAGEEQTILGDHRRQLRNRATRANADGQIASIVMFHCREARGEKQNIDLLRQISYLLLGEASGWNNTQAMLVGKPQDVGDFIDRSRRDRNCRSNAQNVPRLQLCWIFRDVFRSANGAEHRRKTRSRCRGAHSPSCISTGFWVGPEISRHMRGVGKIFCGLSTPAPLKALRRLIMTSRSSSVNSSGIRSRFSIPTPCSPVMEPPH